MSKKTFTQTASDNPYFHQDFHVALSYGINYLHKKFGAKAVKEYLTQFANNYHGSLKEALIEKGLLAIKAHYEKIYKIEGAVFEMNFSQDDLVIYLSESPAVMYIKAGGHTVSPLYQETVITVNKEICRNTPYDCEVIEYENKNGAYKLRFFKR